MSTVELVYFSGCPFIEKARASLREAGVANFSEYNQDKLGPESDYLNYSSPSIIIDQQLALGKRNAGASSCSIVDWSLAGKQLKKFLRP